MRANLDLFLTFARISASCFGGGYAMLPFFQRELVRKKGWLTDEELLDLTAESPNAPPASSPSTPPPSAATAPGDSLALCGPPWAFWCPP